MKLRPLKVQEVNNYIKNIMLRDPILNRMAIEGEVSNFKLHSSQHAYFSLKDGDAKISCVMFNANLTVKQLALEDGHKVICHGYVSIYEKDGKYQLYVKEIEKVGLGALYEQFELLKKELESLGYFDHRFKKILPTYPKKVALITSPTGAVIRDMLTVSGRRCPMTDIVLIPTAVQGDRAPGEIVASIQKASQLAGVEVIILARGGGSLEELWAFNDRSVAEAIYNCPLPIVSAVGHETDFTIADFVSDLRAATPSEAAEMVFPDVRVLLREVDHLMYTMEQHLNRKLKHYETVLSAFNPIKVHGKLISENDHKRMGLEHMKDHLSRLMLKRIEGLQNECHTEATALDSLSPLRTLVRGYAIVSNTEGRTLTSVSEVSVNNRVYLRLKDGHMNATIDSINEENPHGEENRSL